MNPRKHIVLLTTWFPPLQSVAVNRMEAFAKYLDASRFELSVITLGTATLHGESMESGTRVIRIKPASSFWKPGFSAADSKLWHYAKVAWRKVRTTVMGDEDKFWSRKAITELRSLNNQKKIDLLISSFSPVAPHLVALEFCREFKTCKWIVDMRDEMSLNPQSSDSERTYYARVEKDINLHAHALTAVSKPIVDYFKTVMPDLAYYEEIRNGFDHDLPEKKITEPHTCFTILHAGSFYGTRKPTPFFEALENLHKKKLLPADWKFICAGASRNFSIPDAFKNKVEIRERVSQAESIQLMAAADLNLLVQPPTGRKGVYTGKVFDYLSVRKPVLAVVDPEDVAAMLILELKAGYVADFTNVQAIEESVLKAMSDWKSGRPFTPDEIKIATLHRKFQVQKLNLLIETLLDVH
jgi:hypothetical protein